MTITTDHGSFEIRDITFAQRRDLHRVEIRVAQGSDEINPESFYELLEFVREMAFGDEEKVFEKLDDNQIDAVLLAAYNKYREGVSKKK